MPKFNEKFWLVTDWSKKAAAWALMQRNEVKKAWKVILYGSAPMTRKQASYSSYAGELETVKLAVNDCKMYLEASKSWSLVTDHQSLVHLMKQKHLSAYQLRVINGICELGDFEISHRVNTDNRIKFVDALSRADLDYEKAGTWNELYSMRINAVSVVTRSKTREQQTNMMKETSYWKEQQDKDEDIKKAKKWLKDGFPEGKFKSNSQLERSLYHNREALVMIDGVLNRKWMVDENMEKNLIIISPKHLTQVLIDCHENAGHPGKTKTMDMILTKFWTIGMQKETEIHVKSCVTCQKRKGLTIKNDLERITRSFFNERVHMDIKSLPEALGYVGYLTVVESFSRMVTLIPIESHRTTHLMGRFYNEYIMRWGVPETLITDNEQGFVSQIAQDFYDLFGIKKKRNVPNRPQANGEAEAFVKISKNVLQAITMENNTADQWPKRLREVEMTLNALPSRVTGFSPFFVVTGREFRIPSSLYNKVPETTALLPHSVRALREKLANIITHIQKVTDTQFENSKKTWAEKEGTPLEVGTKVFLRRYNYKNDVKALAPKYRDGSYKVIKRLGYNYIICPENAQDSSKDLTVNLDQLKEVIETEEDANRRTERRRAYEDAQRRLGFLISADENDTIE